MQFVINVTQHKTVNCSAIFQFVVPLSIDSFPDSVSNTLATLLILSSSVTLGMLFSSVILHPLEVIVLVEVWLAIAGC